MALDSVWRLRKRAGRSTFKITNEWLVLTGSDSWRGDDEAVL